MWLISDHLWEESEALAQSENQATDTNKDWLPKNADKKYPELCYRRVCMRLTFLGDGKQAEGQYPCGSEAHAGILWYTFWPGIPLVYR